MRVITINKIETSEFYTLTSETEVFTDYRKAVARYETLHADYLLKVQENNDYDDEELNNFVDECIYSENKRVNKHLSVHYVDFDGAEFFLELLCHDIKE